MEQNAFRRLYSEALEKLWMTQRQFYHFSYALNFFVESTYVFIGSAWHSFSFRSWLVEDLKMRVLCDANYAVGSGFGYGERYGVTKHHYQGCVAFNKGAFHESVFDKVGEVLVYV